MSDTITDNQELREAIEKLYNESRQMGMLRTGSPINHMVDGAINLITQRQLDVLERVDPFDFVEPCEPECSPERHAVHQAQWDMATRMEATIKQEIEK